MWKKIKEVLCKHTAYKDETTAASVIGTMTASVIDLRPTPATSFQRTETLHHQPSYKLGSHTLNKTNEHCRSLFNLLPTSLRPRQTSHKKGIDASTTTQPSPSIDIIETDYDSGYMSQSLLNRTSSYASCYSAGTTTMPISSSKRYGSIESLLYGHSRSNPANIHVLVRKNFQPFAQAHLAVTKGTIVTALFSRGPWLYIRINSNGKTGYIPRMICSLYQHPMRTNHSSTDSSFLKDTELELTKIPLKTEKYSMYPHKQPINRYLSHSSAIIHDPKQRLAPIPFDERDRRNTYTLPRPPRSKERRLTLSSINYPLSPTKPHTMNIPNESNILMPTRDTDSSSTQDSGYSESTPFFLVQQITPDHDQTSLHPVINPSKKSTSMAHYIPIQRSSLLQIPDSINPSQPHQKPTERQTFLSMRMNDTTKRHSLGIFDTNMNSKMISATNPIRRLPEFALIRNVRREKSQLQQNIKPSMNNLPKSHIQIPASIFLTHHRQKQQFGSSHSAFRPVQPTTKHKRASSEGHSPSISPTSSSSSTSSSNSSINLPSNFSKRRRLSCDIPIPKLSKFQSNSLTRSVYDSSSSSRKKINRSSRTMSEILCDQFSELNLDAIEKDSLISHPPHKSRSSQPCLFTIIKDYQSSRASFSVKRGDCVDVLKQIGRASYLVRKHQNGQMGFVPKTLLIPATTSRVETFLEMHGNRETII